MTAPAGTAEAPPIGAMSRRGVLPGLQLALLVIVLAVVFAWMGPAQFVNALTLGAIYALIAIGYTMVYGIIELINFAHGEMFMVGSFVNWWLLTTLGFSGAILAAAYDALKAVDRDIVVVGVGLSPRGNDNALARILT